MHWIINKEPTLQHVREEIKRSEKRDIQKLFDDQSWVRRVETMDCNKREDLSL